jgi:hypothetical protein
VVASVSSSMPSWSQEIHYAFIDAGFYDIRVPGTVLAAETAEGSPLTYLNRGFGTHQPDRPAVLRTRATGGFVL